MTSPVPKYLRTAAEEAAIPSHLRDHVCDLAVDSGKGVRVPGAGRAHRARFAPGLAATLAGMAGPVSLGDPMAGVGTLHRETGLAVALNDLDSGLEPFLAECRDAGCELSIGPASEIPWSREALIFSPPYYPRTDRRRPNAHDDERRGPVVGFRDSYSCDHPAMIGNPGGVEAIRVYRDQMREVYAHLSTRAGRMYVVTKNWTRLGVELRLDLDTILTAQEAGWTAISRHGWRPVPSLWSRYNAARGGGVQVEDVIVFSSNP